MSFMQKQITSKQAWIKAETSNGTEYIDAPGLGIMVRDSNPATHPLSDKERERIISQLSDYCEGAIESWETVRGHGARLSAPGYMDCTEWTVFDSPEEAEAYLAEMYDDESEEIA